MACNSQNCQFMCCKITRTVPLGTSDEDIIKLHGEFEYKVDLEGKTTVIMGNCPHLTEDNLCGIEETKPAACKDFPKKPGRLFQLCKDTGCGETID